MTPPIYLVIRSGDFGPFSDHVHAIDAAIDFAEKDGKTGRPAKVLVQDGATSRTVWTYGRNPYSSTPGNPANGRAKGTYRLP